MNFIRNNYGFIIGVVAGLVLPIPFVGPFLGGIVGAIYDRRPDFLSLQNHKPKVDRWVDAQLEKFQNRNK